MQPPVFSCSITFSLPGGQIATQLLTSPGPAPKPFAVTGGSSYRNVRGEGTLVEYGKRKGSITFHLNGRSARPENGAVCPGSKPASSSWTSYPGPEQWPCAVASWLVELVARMFGLGTGFAASVSRLASA
jgi:hypothetical protein